MTLTTPRFDRSTRAEPSARARCSRRGSPKCHGTPEEILAEVQRHASGVNLSTIYRTLEVLESVGLVTHAHIGHGAPTYHAVDEHPHIHLVCDACGDVTSVPAGVANPFVDALYLGYGFRTDIAHVSVHGRCQACLADGTGNNADTVRG